MMRGLVAGILGVVWARSAIAQTPAVVADYVPKVQPVLLKYCGQCHGAEKEEGGVGFADLREVGTALRQRVLWKRAAKAIGAGDMPPAEAKVQPTEALRHE